MRKSRFPSALLALLLCGIFYCASAPQKVVPAAVEAYVEQTKSAETAVKESNMSDRDKKSLVGTLQAGAKITTEQAAQLRKHEERERALEEIITRQGEELATAKEKSGILDGLVAAAYIGGTLLVLGLGFLIWRWFKNRAIAKATSIIS